MEILKLLNRIRFELLRILFPVYIINSLKKRKGSCNNCGICCRNCIYLKGKSMMFGKEPINLYPQFCCVYTERISRNPLCRPSPIDALDKKIINIYCGYYWGERK